jgi:ribosome-associated protein
MIEVNSTIRIDESEVQLDFVRASGPGGQNVNKVATSVQLRFNVRNSPSLGPDVKERLIKLAGSRVTEDGVLIIEAKRFRTQEQNRFDATQRLISWIKKALEKPNPRKATRPTITSKAARVGDKKRHGAIKRTRRYVSEEWE